MNSVNDDRNPLFGDLEVWEWFSKPSPDHWQQLAGAGDSQRLVTGLPGGLEIEPLYADDRPSRTIGWPGRPPFVRGSNLLANTEGGWEVCQRAYGPGPLEAARAMALDMDQGVFAFWLRADASARRGRSSEEGFGGFQADGIAIATAADFEPILSAVDTTKIALHLDGGGNGVALAATLVAALSASGQDLHAIGGSYGWDPLGALAGDGELPYGIDNSLALVPVFASWAQTVTPRMRALSVSTLPYQRAGADPILELAGAIATGVEYLRRMVDAGIEIETACGHIRFVTGIGRDLFVEAAKLRVLRGLWSRVIEAFGGAAGCPVAPIHAVTSPRCLSQRDPWVNMLRTTVESTAAVIGGADCLTVLPFDSAIGVPDDFGRRMAANAHAIMAEESHLHRIADPAGGSYFVEQITEEMAQAAWSRFQRIEADGGMAAALTDGTIMADVDRAAGAQNALLATRRWPVTGVSSFSNLNETPVLRPSARSSATETRPSHQESLDELPWATAPLEAVVDALSARATLIQVAAAIRGSAAATVVIPIAAGREAADFERLRDASDRWLETHGSRPRASLVKIGAMAAHRVRADFARNLLEAGGIDVVATDGFETTDKAVAAFVASGSATAAICSSDEVYATVGPAVARALRAAGARTVVLTGGPGDDEEQWRQAGVDFFLHPTSDALAVLTGVLEAEGVING